MSENKHARCKLMEYKLKSNVNGYIQGFCTLMYNVAKMTQGKAFTLFMRGLEHKIGQQIGYHMEGDMGRAMSMPEKVDRAQGRETKKG